MWIIFDRGFTMRKLKEVAPGSTFRVFRCSSSETAFISYVKHGNPVLKLRWAMVEQGMKEHITTRP
jgi:hypothetical protein